MLSLLLGKLHWEWDVDLLGRGIRGQLFSRLIDVARLNTEAALAHATRRNLKSIDKW